MSTKIVSSISDDNGQILQRTDVAEYKGQSPILGAFTGMAIGSTASISMAELFENKRIFINLAEDTAKLVKDRHWLTHVAIAAVTALSTWAGYRVAKNGKDQFESASAGLAQQTARADALQMQVEGLSHEAETHRKSFAELHAKHEQHAGHVAQLAEKSPLGAHSPEGAHLSHAAHHESRAEHGSHAEAALHDKHEAASAEHAV